MSRGSVWFGPCSDGKWYEEPVWHDGDDRGDGWTYFIAVDEDDPTELVWLKDTDPPAFPWMKGRVRRGCTSGRTLNLNAFVLAHSAYVRLTGIVPPPKMYQRVVATREEIRGEYTLIVVSGNR